LLALKEVVFYIGNRFVVAVLFGLGKQTADGWFDFQLKP
jgi:hypothetical protein